MSHPTKPKVALARHMRKALTGPEWLLWERLKDRRDGLVFKRQHALGPYVLDFYCFKARLVVEVDGSEHHGDERRQKDAVRDVWLNARGLMVYRIPAAEVYRDVEGVADGVRVLALSRVTSK